MLQILESAIDDGLFCWEWAFELAEIFKEGGADECLLVFVDGYLSDFENEIEEEEWDLLYVAAEDLEKVSELFGGDIDEIVLFDLTWLHADEVFTLFVVVFAEQL